jgi:hypothetical protein
MGLLSDITDVFNPFNAIGEGYQSSNYGLDLLSPEQSEYLKKLIPMLYGGASGESNPALESMLSTGRASAENNWTQNTKPQILESAGNLHSSYTGNKIGQEYNNMQQGLNTNESTMRYQSQMDQLKSLLAALGISTKENIVEKPGMVEGLMGGLGNLGSGGQFK